MTNTITIDGRLADAPDLRFIQSGKAVANVRFGHTPREKKDGEWVDGETTWLSAELWGSDAELAAETLGKGDLVLVSGELRARTFEANGTERTTFEIKRASVALMRKKGAGQSRPAPTSQPASNDPWASVPAPSAEDEPRW